MSIYLIRKINAHVKCACDSAVRWMGWESIFWMWQNSIFQMSANIDAYCIISLAREYWSPRIPQFAEADMRTTCEHCYEPWVWTHSHVSCYMYLGESWWWCVGAVREGRNTGSVCPLWWGGVVTGVIRWHWPPAPSQYYTHPLHSFLSSIVTADGLTWSNE